MMAKIPCNDNATQGFKLLNPAAVYCRVFVCSRFIGPNLVCRWVLPCKTCVGSEVSSANASAERNCIKRECWEPSWCRSFTELSCCFLFALFMFVGIVGEPVLAAAGLSAPDSFVCRQISGFGVVHPPHVLLRFLGHVLFATTQLHEARLANRLSAPSPCAAKPWMLCFNSSRTLQTGPV